MTEALSELEKYKLRQKEEAAKNAVPRLKQQQKGLRSLIENAVGPITH